MTDYTGQIDILVRKCVAANLNCNVSPVIHPDTFEPIFLTSIIDCTGTGIIWKVSHDRWEEFRDVIESEVAQYQDDTYLTVEELSGKTLLLGFEPHRMKRTTYQPQNLYSVKPNGQWQ